MSFLGLVYKYFLMWFYYVFFLVCCLDIKDLLEDLIVLEDDVVIDVKKGRC